MNNLRKFNTLADYKAATLNYPAVSWIVSGDTVKYDLVEPTPFDITLYFNIADSSEEKLLYSSNGEYYTLQGVEEVWVDGVQLQYPVNTYRFTTTGEHVVGIVLSATTISDGAFHEYYNTVLGETQYIEAYKIEFGDRITRIDSYWMFDGLEANEMILGENVTNLNLATLTSATLLTSKALVPPAVGSNYHLPQYLTNIYVPSESVDAYKAATGWSSFSGIISAIPNS